MLQALQQFAKTSAGKDMPHPWQQHMPIYYTHTHLPSRQPVTQFIYDVATRTGAISLATAAAAAHYP
jgi:hypothetical protein